MLTSNLLSETFLIQATSLADETANASMPVRESAKSVVRVSYTIEAVGDFQGESNADILLSSNNGDYVLWLAGQQENAFSLGNKKASATMVSATLTTIRSLTSSSMKTVPQWFLFSKVLRPPRRK